MVSIVFNKLTCKMEFVGECCGLPYRGWAVNLTAKQHFYDKLINVDNLINF